jgi:ABC-2 type transport system permease protein
LSRPGRVASEATAAYRTFVRRRTAVFFTFFFPVLLIVIFAGLVQTTGTGASGGAAGLFSQPTGYYVPAYLAVVVLFTPLSRLGSTVARHREGNRFEKLATTPLARWEWLLAHTLVNTLLIAAACTVLLVALLATGAEFALSPLLAPFVVLGSVLFCGVGALIGRVADSQDGAISMSNGIALPLLFLSDTFIEPALFPDWFQPLLALSPLTYFARGVRAATYAGGDAMPALGVVAVLAVGFFVVGAVAVPWTE